MEHERLERNRIAVTTLATLTTAKTHISSTVPPSSECHLVLDVTEKRCSDST